MSSVYEMTKLGVLAASSFELCIRVRKNSDLLSTEVPLCHTVGLPQFGSEVLSGPEPC